MKLNSWIQIFIRGVLYVPPACCFFFQTEILPKLLLSLHFCFFFVFFLMIFLLNQLRWETKQSTLRSITQRTNSTWKSPVDSPVCWILYNTIRVILWPQWTDWENPVSGWGRQNFLFLKKKILVLLKMDISFVLAITIYSAMSFVSSK